MNSIRQIICLSLFPMLPVGYLRGAVDSSHVAVGAGAGLGDYGTLVEGCEGERRVNKVNFHDVGGQIEVRPTRGSPLVFGLRGGYLLVDEPPARHDGGWARNRSADSPCMNPYASLEFRPIGIGGGWFRNLGPVYDPEKYHIQEIDFRRYKDLPSGHLRIGPASSWFVLASFCEGVPVMTQYGTTLGAVGYGGSGFGSIMGGASGGLYDHAGFFLGLRSRKASLGTVTWTMRVGRNYGAFEGSSSVEWETSFW